MSRYMSRQAKSLLSEVIKLAVLDAKKGDEEAKFWLYTDACEGLNLALGAIEPSAFRRQMSELVGLPKGYTCLSSVCREQQQNDSKTAAKQQQKKPKQGQNRGETGKEQGRKAALQTHHAPIQMVPVIDSSRPKWACQYAFKAVWDMPIMPSCRKRRKRIKRVASTTSNVIQMRLF